MRNSLGAIFLLFFVAMPSAAEKRRPSPTDETLKNAGTLVFAGRIDEARRAARSAMEAYRAESDRVGEGAAVLMLGIVDVGAQNIAAARAEIATASSILQSTGDGFAAWMALWMSADLERSTGNFTAAIERYEYALDFLRDAAAPEKLFPMDGAALIVKAFGQDPSMMDALATPAMKPFILQMTEALTRDAYGGALVEAGYLQEADYQLGLAAASSKQFMGMLDATIEAHRGDLYRRLWCLNDARASYKKALSGSGGLPLMPVHDEWIQVKLFGQLAEIELLEDRLDSALHWNDKALAAVKTTNPKQAAAVLESRGDLLLRAGRTAAAEKAFTEALAIADEQHDLPREASVRTYLGGLFILGGRYDEAAKALEAAVDLYQKGGKPDAEALTWTGLSEVYILLGANDSARVTLERARKLAANSGFRLAQVLVDVVATAISDRKARHTFGAWWELPEAGGLMLDADARRVMRELFGLSSGTLMPPEMTTKSSPVLLALGRLLRGKLMFQRGQIGAAREEWTNALKDNPSRDLRIALLAGIGATYSKEGNDAEALGYFDRAVQALELPVDDARVEDVMAGYFGSYRHWYFDILVDLLARKGMVKEAFEQSERARARAFQQMVGSTRLRATGGRPELVREAEKLRAEIRRMESEELFTPAGAGEALRVARERYQGVLARVKVTSPEYASLTRVEPLALADVQRELPPKTTLISYFVTSASVHAWIVDGDRLEYAALPIRAPALQRAVCWASDLGRRRGRGATPVGGDCDAEATATAEEIYDELVAPLRSRIRNDRLLIVPHGVLHYVPFGALRDRKTNRYLIEDYTLAYLPSAGSLRFLKRKETPVNGGALVIGDPSEAHPLPGAKSEADFIARAFNTEAITGGRATETLLRHLDGRFDLVHIGAHGTYNAATPMFSRLELAKDPADADSDGYLEVHEILSEVDLSGVNLVVLSACRSAVGARSGGDDVVGLTRGVLYAGSPGVISTLWNIDDEASSELMQAFYRQLRAGVLAADALRAAQLDLLRRERFRAPKFWAAFILTGNPQGRWGPPSF